MNLGKVFGLIKLYSSDKTTLKPENRYPKHHPPKYSYRDGEWVVVLVCDCGSISSQLDNMFLDPCRDCGTLKERKKHSGRWVGNKWELHNE